MSSVRLVRATVWINEESLRWLAREADRVLPCETGGVLVGYRLADGLTYVVTSFVGPGLYAEHAPDSFEPDYAFHRREVARHYFESGRRHVYLGDWHTHPGGAAEMSRSDTATLFRIAQDPNARVSNPLMVILSGGPRWTFSCWAFRRCLGPGPWPRMPQPSKIRCYRHG